MFSFQFKEFKLISKLFNRSQFLFHIYSPRQDVILQFNLDTKRIAVYILITFQSPSYAKSSNDFK